MRKIKFLVICAMLMILGASCVPILSLDMEVSLKQTNKWDIATTLVLTGVVNEQSSALIAQSLSDSQSQLAADGTKMDWKQLSADENGNVPYRIVVRDVNTESLNGSILSGNDFSINQVDGQRQIIFHMNPIDRFLIPQSSITLKGKKVISSNGQQIGAGTVRWNNPTGTMEAVMIEGPMGFPIGVIFLLIGASLVGGGFWYYRHSISKANSTIYPNPIAFTQVIQPANHYCTECGYQLPGNAQFCPKCGKQQLNNL